MPDPCSRIYADIKYAIRFDSIFDIRLWNNFHVKPYTINLNLVTIFLVWFSMGAIPKFDIKSAILNLILYLISAKKSKNQLSVRDIKNNTRNL